MSGSHGLKILMLGSAALIPPLAAPALAQAAPGVSANIATEGDIVVTASKRNEHLSDVPLSVQALTGSDLQKLGARSFSDYANMVAGVQHVDAGAGRDQIFMRGIAAPQGYIGMQSAIGVYLDEVPISEGLNQPDLNLYDVERVEVLRGPQGTLYGSASMGGTIKLVTNKPDASKFGGFVDADLSYTSHGGASGQYNAVLNLPVIRDILAVRGVLYGRNMSGYIDSPVLAQKNVNDENTYGGRFAIRYTPSKQLTVDLMATHQGTVQGAINRVDSVAGDIGALTQYRHLNEDYHDISTVLNGSIHYAGDAIDIVSSTSYNRRKRKEDDDLTGPFQSPDPADPNFGVVPSLQIYHTRVFTQEVRLSSVGAGLFSWIVGGYYSNVKNRFFQTVDASNAVAAFGTPTSNIAVLSQSSTTKELAGFGELSLHPFQGFTATAGLRYEHISLEATSARTGLLFDPGLADADRTKQNVAIPKFNLSYKFAPHVLVYAQAGKGFRIGGLNVSFASLGDGFVFPRSYKSDSLWNYEVGLKGTTLGGRINFAIDAFLIDWKDIQLDLQHGPYDYFTNAGNARSKGIEAELGARLGRHWDVGGQLSYTDSKLTTTTPGVGTKGDRVPFVPKVSASGYLEYHAEIAGLGRSYVRGDVQRVGTAYTGFGSANNFAYSDYEIANFKVGANISGTDVALYLKNAFDKRARLYANPYQGGFAGVDAISYTIARPRTFGIEMSRKF